MFKKGKLEKIQVFISYISENNHLNLFTQKFKVI